MGNLQKGDYTIASFNVTSAQAAVEDSGTDPDTSKASDSAAGDNATSTSMDGRPLKIQIEYTDAKGERITVDKDVAVPASGFGTGGSSGARGDRSSGLSSSMSYIVVIVIAGAGVFLYRKQKKGAKKAEYKASENDSSSGMLKN
ncbi:hypothetical protein BGV40_01500 [Methanosarcina sp. Ant1]|nr:hypothetical protein BGV40_01500 [Methanosarcina sp. Ant1]